MEIGGGFEKYYCSGWVGMKIYVGIFEERIRCKKGEVRGQVMFFRIFVIKILWFEDVVLREGFIWLFGCIFKFRSIGKFMSG